MLAHRYMIIVAAVEHNMLPVPEDHTGALRCGSLVPTTVNKPT